jgi:hypothetical protein
MNILGKDIDIVSWFVQAYNQAHPDVLIIDPPDSIKQLQNRQSMLSNVVKLDLLDCGGEYVLNYCLSAACLSECLVILLLPREHGDSTQKDREAAPSLKLEKST